MRRQDGLQADPSRLLAVQTQIAGCWAIARYFAVDRAVGVCGEQDNVGSLFTRCLSSRPACSGIMFGSVDYDEALEH